MKLLSIYLAALSISLISFGSLKPINCGNKGRSPALEVQSYSLKSSIVRYLVVVNG